MRRAKPAACIALALSLGACVATRPTPTAAEPFRAGPTRPTKLVVHAADLVRAPGSVARYRVFEGTDAGSVIEERVTRDDDGRVALAKSMICAGKEPKPIERLLLAPDALGGLTLREVETYAEDSRSVFDSGLAFASAELPPGGSLEGRSAMHVRTLSTGAARAKGDATRSLRLSGETDVQLGAEKLTAAVLAFEFVAKLDAAKARVTSTIYVVPGRGVVAESREEKLLVMGIFPRNTTERTALESVGPAAAPQPANDRNR